MSTTLSGQLHDLDYSDSYVLAVKPGEYSYELTGMLYGTVAVKVEYHETPPLGSTEHDHWWKIEGKERARSGTSIDGEFNVPKVYLDADTVAEKTEIKVTLSRAFASLAVDYRFIFQPA